MTPNIFEYTDYRDFLKDFYRQKKVENRDFSYRWFAKKAGFASASFLPFIMEGKRNLTESFIPRFADAMDLSKRERRYFEALVSFNQAKNAEAKRYYFQLLCGIRRDKVGKLLEDEQFEYLSNWYYAVIRELVALPDFRDDPEWIKRQLRDKITAGQAREAVERLLKLGLLKRGEDDRLMQTDASVFTKDKVQYTAVYSFHQQMLTLAKEILAATNGDGNEISGLTMPLSKKQFAEIRKMIHDFENDIVRYLTDNPDVPEAVSQLNIQLLNVTNNVNGRKNA